MARSSGKIVALLAIIAVLLVMAPPPASAATYTVTTEVDGGPGSLRYGLEAGFSRIVFDPEVYELRLESPLEFNGPQLFIEGSGQEFFRGSFDGLITENATRVVIENVWFVSGGGRSVHVKAPPSGRADVTVTLRRVANDGDGSVVYVDDSAGSAASIVLRIFDSSASLGRANAVVVDEAGRGDITFVSQNLNLELPPRGVVLSESGEGGVRYNMVDTRAFMPGAFLDVSEADAGSVGGVIDDFSVNEYDLLDPAKVIVRESGPGSLQTQVRNGSLRSGGLQFVESGSGNVAIRVSDVSTLSYSGEAIDVRESNGGNAWLRLDRYELRDRDGDSEGAAVSFSESGWGDLRTQIFDSDLAGFGGEGLVLAEAGDGDLRARIERSVIIDNPLTDLTARQAGDGTGLVTVIESEVGTVLARGVRIR